jgi:FkbM family methyltransferase
VSTIRTVVERVSRGRTLRRRLPARVGGAVIYATPDAALRWLKPGEEAFDPELLDAAQELVGPGARVWDIGANVGVFGLAAASLAGPSGSVLCVEADAWLASLLERSRDRLDARNAPLDVVQAAISDRAGLATFCIARRGRASNSLEEAGGRVVAGGVRERRVVPTITADDLLASRDAPTVVKIDVEGAEVMVLRGATRVLGEARPVVYIEVGEEHVDEVTEILHGANYDLFDPLEPRESRRPLDACRFNTIAVPR